jgi:hypothetical protein
VQPCLHAWLSSADKPIMTLLHADNSLIAGAYLGYGWMNDFAECYFVGNVLVGLYLSNNANSINILQVRPTRLSAVRPSVRPSVRLSLPCTILLTPLTLERPPPT